MKDRKESPWAILGFRIWKKSGVEEHRDKLYKELDNGDTKKTENDEGTGENSLGRKIF